MLPHFLLTFLLPLFFLCLSVIFRRVFFTHQPVHPPTHPFTHLLIRSIIGLHYDIMTYRVWVSCVDAWNTITMTKNAVHIFVSVRVCMVCIGVRHSRERTKQIYDTRNVTCDFYSTCAIIVSTLS